jgi:hypothetical protein
MREGEVKPDRIEPFENMISEEESSDAESN